MSYENQDLTEHYAKHVSEYIEPNCEYCHEPQNMLTAMLNSMKGTKMPNSTTFGNLNGIVPRPYSKFENMDNPPPEVPND